MKNCFTKIFIAFIIAVTTVQCSSDDNKTDATDTKKLIKLVTTAYPNEVGREDGVYTMDFVYDKNKVTEIKQDVNGPSEKYNYKTVYTYTGEKLKNDKTYYNNTLIGEATYTYNGNLMSRIDGYAQDGDYFQTFEYDANGFLSKYTQKYIKSSYQEIKTYENDAKGNTLIKREYSVTNTEPSYVTTYEYDDKKNPFKGLPSLFYDMTRREGNNVIKETENNNKITTYSYTYDTDGYPVEALYYDNGKLGGKVVFSYNK